MKNKTAKIILGIVSILLSTVLVIGIGQKIDRKNVSDDLGGKGGYEPGNFVCSRWFNSYTCDFPEFLHSQIFVLPFEMPFILGGTVIFYYSVIVIMKKRKI